MGSLFNLDNPIWRFMGKLVDVFILTLLWAVCCIPIITIGPASTAVYYVTLKLVRDEESYTVRSFFKSFKENFKQGSVIGIIMTLLDPDNGMITNLIQTITGQHIMVLTDSRYFVPMLIITDIYKGLGWGTIIYFAAISGIDPSLYEAAAIDGAGKWKQAINITLPCIVPTIIIQFILSSSNILNAGFDQIFMLYTSHVYDVADIIDTYVYRMGIINNDYSFSTAAGMFKSVVALIMILFVNQVAKRTGNEGLF